MALIPAVDPLLLLLPAEIDLSGPMAVGWSGGIDSTALLLALRAAGADVRAWHVDHGWRETSAAEAVWLAGKASDWEIPFDSVRLPRASGRNREAEARSGRYRQFVEWGEKQGIRRLFLGHHRNDQAETVYMRMLQGAGVGGCRGIRDVIERLGLRIERPLLAVDRFRIESAMRKSGVAWLEDDSNRDLTLQRNHTRCRVFPAMRAAGVDPVDLFCRWAVQASRVADELEAVSSASELRHEGDQVRIAWHSWVSGSPAIRARLLQRMASDLFGQGVTPGRRHILLAETWTQNGGRGGLDLSGCRLERRRDDLHLKRAGAMLR